MGKSNVARFTAGATIHTDDNALVEFAAPRGLTMGIYQWPLMEAIEQYREADLSFLTSSERDAKALAETKAQASRLIEARGDVYQAYFLKNRGESAKMIEQLQKAASLNPNDDLLSEFFDSLQKEAFEMVQSRSDRSRCRPLPAMIDILPTGCQVPL